MGSLKASYTFLLSLPLRTHELSSLPLLLGDQDQTQVCRVLVFVLRLARQGVQQARYGACSALSWRASCTLALN